jgi:CRAL/TRIO domain
MDAKFILKFLRFRKFNIPETKEAFERYLVFREGLYGYDWFSNLDVTKPNIDSLIDNGVVVIFKTPDEMGRKILLIRLAVADPSIPNIATEGCTLATVVIEVLLDDEENQIRGLVYIIDVADIKLRHYFLFPFSAWFKFAKNVEVSKSPRRSLNQIFIFI